MSLPAAYDDDHSLSTSPSTNAERAQERAPSPYLGKDAHCSSVDIRPATLEDIGELVALGRAMHSESNFSFLPFVEAKVASYLRDLISTPERSCVLVAVRDGALIGGIAAYITEYFFCDALLAIDSGLFLAKEHRGGPTAGRLIRAFISWSRKQRVAEACLSISTGLGVERAHKMFLRAGFSQVGGVYKLRIGA